MEVVRLDCGKFSRSEVVKSCRGGKIRQKHQGANSNSLLSLARGPSRRHGGASAPQQDWGKIQRLGGRSQNNQRDLGVARQEVASNQIFETEVASNRQSGMEGFPDLFHVRVVDG